MAMLAETTEPRPDLDYIHVTLTAREDGGLEHTVTSHWVGFESYKPLVEKRVPSIVDPDWFIRHWTRIGETYSVVTTESEVYRYLMYGGHALIEKSLAERFLPFVFQSLSCRRHGELGFVSTRSLPRDAYHRVPTRKTRLRVIKRDQWRCVVCGRRPVDHLDVELHVHHIRPWSDGGATVDDNLVTLCQTCHGGLEPHFEMELFRLTGNGLLSVPEHTQKYLAGVERYRRLTSERLATEKPSGGPQSLGNKRGPKLQTRDVHSSKR